MKRLLSAMLLLGTSAQAKEFLLSPDTRAKAASGAGLYYSSGSSSLFYNPANLSKLSGNELKAELSLGSVDYSYTPASDAKAGGISLKAPPVFFGGAMDTPLGIKLGAAFIPKGTGQASTIDKLPMSVQGSQITVKAVQTDKSFRYGLGAAAAPMEGLRIGAGILGDVDDQSTLVYGDALDPTVSMSNRGSFQRYTFGGTYSLDPHWSLAAAYTSALVKEYKGEIKLFQNLGQTASSTSDFLPSEIKLGGQLHLKRLTLDLEYSYLRYASGRYFRRTGISNGTIEEKDFVNTHNLRVAGSYRSGRETFIGGFAMLPSSVGYGRFKQQTSLAGTADVEVSGIQMSADFDYVNQYIFSTGLMHRYSSSTQFGFYGSYLAGRKDVPVFAPNPGQYRLNVIQLGFGTEYNL